MHAELRDRGHHLSKRTVANLMTSRRDGREASNSLRPPRRKRRVPVTTNSRRSHAVAPNLLDRNFKIAAPDAVWLADISYIPTDEGWLYLAAVKDLATQEIVGPLSAIASDRLPGNGSMSERLKSTLCEDALKMAIRNRRPSRGLIHHSDRGVQYACGDYRKLLALHGITASMSRKGNCLDNAPMVHAARRLRVAQDGARASHPVPDPGRSEASALPRIARAASRRYRDLLQPPAPTLEHRLPNASPGKDGHGHGAGRIDQ
ncbi:MAG: IS3 family transposase [Pseudomonadota bacterium]